MKKKFIGLFLLFALVACGELPQKFDSMEYGYYVTLYQEAQHLKQHCGTPNTEPYLSLLFLHGESLGIYVHYTSNDASRAFASRTLKLIDGFKHDGSKYYCEAYMNNMQQVLIAYMQTLGARTK
jgi:hypothetical protein